MNLYMEVPLSALLRRGPHFQTLRVYYMDQGLPSCRCRSWFWPCPLACCVTWYKSLTSPLSLMADSCRNIHCCLQCHSQSLATGVRTGWSCVTCQRNQAASYSLFSDKIELAWINSPEAQKQMV